MPKPNSSDAAPKSTPVKSTEPLDHTQTAIKEAREDTAAVHVAAVLIEEICRARGDWSMTCSQLMCLLHLRLHGTVPQADLIARLGVDKTGVSKILQKLGGGEPTLKKNDDGSETRALRGGYGLVDVNPVGLGYKGNEARLSSQGRSLVDTAARRTVGRVSVLRGA